MFDFLKRKRCPQCGEELRMFKKVKYCSLNCASIAMCDEMLAAITITNDAADVIHDAIYDIFDHKPSAFEIVRTYMKIPEHIHNEGKLWGWQDTEVRGQVHEFLRGAGYIDR
ncbi:hypothetical protein MG295_00160 [Bacillus phage vB_BcgM]|nr:hypothetical protein MG295_00160 [Bacillus phage vB_BcgM]